jgi:hypothetical protein
MTFADIVRSLRDYPGFFPGLLVAGAVALLFRDALGARIGVGRAMAAGLILSVGLIVAATLTPGVDPPHGGPGCDLSRLRLPPFRDVSSLGEVSLNVLLFVPLGLVLGLLTRSRARMVLIAGAIALPIAIESLQLLVTPLDRACQSADVVDNLTGLGIGMAAGVIAGRLRTRGPAGPDRDPAGPDRDPSRPDALPPEVPR